MSLQGKTTMSDDFELVREDEMDPMSSVTFSTLLLVKSGTRIENRWAFVCL